MRPAAQVLVALAFLGTAGTVAADAQTTISTETTAGGHSYVGFQELTFGQTFQAPNPADVFLSTFRLSVGSPALLPYTVRLMEWDAGNVSVGSLLYEESFAQTPATRTYRTFTVGQLLSFGADYIFAVSLTPNGASVENHIDFADPYPGGSELFVTESTDLASAQWNVRGGDIGFTAEFLPGSQTVVPEPSTLFLLGTGLVGVSVGLRRRRDGGGGSD